MTSELWAVIGTVIGIVVFLLVPGIFLAWYALDLWIDDDAGYDHIVDWVVANR